MTKLINLPHLADQVFGVPHYATRQTMDSVKAVLIPRIQGAVTDAGITMALTPDNQPEPAMEQPAGGIAVISVHGILVPRRGQITAMCTELTSYER
ncbi:S49 family peptidase, partial [Salmonella enterica subsp. enterica]|nr:S49 family peptidase [Salmonella enterica subsp. enterica serovar Lattenkamp]EAM8932917.1 S49 family peptidase [Salmonella enterica]EDV3566768.1 S49 family peptidase [Salmonella enterica subsp. enterica]HAK8950459.1 S49 family peptidase [Salmonella enterica]